MSKRRKDRATIGDYLVYAVYRSVSFLLSLLPVTWVFRGGQAVGFLGYVLLFPYRELARRNVRIAFPDWSSREIERWVRTHFQNLVANLLTCVALREKSWEEAKRLMHFAVVEEVAEDTTRRHASIPFLA